MSTRTLVLAQHDNQQLDKASLSTLQAALALAAPVDLLVAGYGCAGVAEQAQLCTGVDRVICADDPAYAHGLAENIAQLLQELSTDYSAVLAPATTYGKDILPRLAACCGVCQVSEVTEIIDPTTFVRPIYAGNALATVKVDVPLLVMTVRTTAFSPVTLSNQPVATLTHCSISADAQLSEFVDLAQSSSERPDLASAQVIVSGGRGLGSAEQFALLEPLADQLGAAIGATRAAVDAGFVPNDYQIGQTGKVVAPALYIAVGISGAIQHLAGMKDSQVIVAINKDAQAPIFEVADFGLVGDLFELVPELTQALANRQQNNQ